MADEAEPQELRSASSARQAPQDDFVNPELSTPVMRDTSMVLLGPGNRLPSHLMQLLEEWHKEHPYERPLAGYKKKNSNDEERIFAFFTQDGKQCPPMQEILIIKPVHYSVGYLPIRQGTQTGALVRSLTWGNRILFMKKWLGDNNFQAHPIAVRLIQFDGNFDFPDDSQWERATERKLPIELKAEEDEPFMQPTVPRKRSHEEVSDSGSSSGGDIYHDFIRPSTRQQGQRARSVHVRPSDAVLASDEEGDAAPTGLSNKGLPIISRSATASRFLPNAQTLTSRNPASRASLPRTLNGGTALLTSPLTVNAPSTTTSDSGIDLTTSSSNKPHPNPNSTGPAIITFKLRIPRTRMERHIRLEESENSSQELFKDATQYFRRYDRLMGTPVLECVIEGEPDCRLVFNEKELRFFIEELRERRGNVKVTMTQSY